MTLVGMLSPCLAENNILTKQHIKLVHFPSCCLPLLMQPSLSAGSRVVVHDVPVNVVPRRLWAEFEEPNMPDFDVSEDEVVL